VGEGFRDNGYIVNLSYGGAGIAGTKKLPENGVELLLTIRPMKERIEILSKVIWVNSQSDQYGPATFGVEFLGRLEEKKEKIRTFFPKYYEAEG
jgi:Tfp pilus assembly protein PilZ